ncbi:MAG: methylamine utilization protein [Undibacterium sp.]|nr:methylamine utilization protein [Undibacterium sp.]
MAATLTVTVKDKDGKLVADAVVYLEGKAAISKRHPASLEIAQKDKKFLPLVSVAQVGSSISFPNRDEVQHQVYSFSPVKRFELKLYAGTPSNPIIFDKAGTVALGCNIHDSMLAYILIVDTPLFGKTDAQGKFVFKDITEGEYTVKTWHFQLPNELATKPQQVDIKNTMELTLALPFKAKEWSVPKSENPYY